MLTPKQLEQFKTDGFLVLRGLFPEADAEIWRDECKRILGLGLADQFNLRTHPHFLAPGIWIVDRVEPVIDISPTFAELAGHEIFRSLLTQIFDDVPLLFKDKLVYKMVGTPGYGIHQDYSWWQEFPPEIVNVMIAIDSADAGNGALEFFAGRHGRLLTPPNAGRNFNREEVNLLTGAPPQMIETHPGDVVLFHCMLPHRSGPNRSSNLRRQLYLTYSSARNGDFYSRQLQLLRDQRPLRGPNSDQRESFYFR